ncbi:MAG: phosphoglycerate mutase family protein [Kiritimatiellaeota bacterium]|nr:phosphoglycerate mutase family protein [Kiritimatiellota bacterium]
MIEITFIRHADPDYKNDTITELGHQQAQALAEHFKRTETTFTAIFASHFGRAQATMKYTAEALRMPWTIFNWLGEPDGRSIDGRWSWAIPRAEHLEKNILFDAANWRTLTPYGENLFAIQAERFAALNEFLAGYGLVYAGLRYRVMKAGSEHFAMFAHEGLIKVMLSALLHWPLPYVFAHLTCEPTGVTRLVWDEHESYAVPRAVAINARVHLALKGG